MRTSAAVSSASAALLLWVCGTAQAVTVPNFSGPGVSSPGYPDFWGVNTTATLTQTNSGFTLSMSGSTGACGSGSSFASCSAAVFNFPSGVYAVGHESISLTANFTSSGVFTSGTYMISGSLPAWSNPTAGAAPKGFSWGAAGTQPLLTANLTGDTVDTADEALGFTEVITGGWADQAPFTGTNSRTTTESVWLYSLLSGFSRDDGEGKRGSGSAWNAFLSELRSNSGLKANTFAAVGSIATVPLPAAAVLFGSGLLGLIGMARRRRLSVAS